MQGITEIHENIVSQKFGAIRYKANLGNIDSYKHQCTLMEQSAIIV